MVHGSEIDALAAAAIALTDALNNRPRQRGKPERYTKLTGPEFSVLLTETGLTPTFFRGAVWHEQRAYCRMER